MLSVQPSPSSRLTLFDAPENSLCIKFVHHKQLFNHEMHAWVQGSVDPASISSS